MTSIISLISNLFGAVKEFFGFQNKRLELKNDPRVKDAVERQQQQDVKDKINKAIAEKDVDEIKKMLS